MDKQWFKEAYLRLPSPDRKEIARWILDLELGASPTAGLASVPRPRRTLPKGALIGFLGALLILGAGWGAFQWKKNLAMARAAESAAEREIRERAEPQSPKNLGFIRAHVGKEITIRGIPEDFEVGYLYFSRDRSSALRLNLFVNGVVLLQSSDLEALVKSRQELQVTGTILQSPQDGAHEIHVSHPGQLVKLGKP